MYPAALAAAWPLVSMESRTALSSALLLHAVGRGAFAFSHVFPLLATTPPTSCAPKDTSLKYSATLAAGEAPKIVVVIVEIGHEARSALYVYGVVVLLGYLSGNTV